MILNVFPGWCHYHSLEEGGPKIAKIFYTSFMDGPLCESHLPNQFFRFEKRNHRIEQIETCPKCQLVIAMRSTISMKESFLLYAFCCFLNTLRRPLTADRFVVFQETTIRALCNVYASLVSNTGTIFKKIL